MTEAEMLSMVAKLSALRDSLLLAADQRKFLLEVGEAIHDLWHEKECASYYGDED